MKRKKKTAKIFEFGALQKYLISVDINCFFFLCVSLSILFSLTLRFSYFTSRRDRKVIKKMIRNSKGKIAYALKMSKKWNNKKKEKILKKRKNIEKWTFDLTMENSLHCCSPKKKRNKEKQNPAFYAITWVEEEKRRRRSGATRWQETLTYTCPFYGKLILFFHRLCKNVKKRFRSKKHLGSSLTDGLIDPETFTISEFVFSYSLASTKNKKLSKMFVSDWKVTRTTSLRGLTKIPMRLCFGLVKPTFPLKYLNSKRIWK